MTPTSANGTKLFIRLIDELIAELGLRLRAHRIVDLRSDRPSVLSARWDVGQKEENPANHRSSAAQQGKLRIFESLTRV